MKRSISAASAMTLLLAACGGGGTTGTHGTDQKYTTVAQCPTAHVVSCVHKAIQTASGIPNDITTHDCIEIYSDGRSVAEAQASAITKMCDATMNTASDTYTLGSGCPHGDEKQGCLNGSSGAGFCSIEWVLNDDPTNAGEYAMLCTAANSAPVGP